MVTLNGFFKDYEPNNIYKYLILIDGHKLRYNYISDVLEAYGNCPIYFWVVINNCFVIAITD